jgi:hypothetical protein
MRFSPTILILPVLENEVENTIQDSKGKHSAGIDEVPNLIV